METYTGVADTNGDFTVNFSSSYTSGEKITVIAEKNSVIKTIELHAPSEIISGESAIQISGSWSNFPNDIGNLTMLLPGSIASNSFWYRTSNIGFSKATGLTLLDTVSIGHYAFWGWVNIVTLNLPNTLTTIGSSAFESTEALLSLIIPNSVIAIGPGAFRGCSAIQSLTLGSGLTSIGGAAFSQLTSCDEMMVLAVIPPTIATNTFEYLNSTCIIKVPAESLTTYKTAENWSDLAARIQAI